MPQKVIQLRLKVENWRSETFRNGELKKKKKTKSRTSQCTVVQPQAALKGDRFRGKRESEKEREKEQAPCLSYFGPSKNHHMNPRATCKPGNWQHMNKEEDTSKGARAPFFFLFSLKTQSSAVPGNVQPLNFLAESHVQKPSTCAHAKPNNLFQITKMTSKKAKHMQAFYGEPQHPTTRSAEQLAANWRQTKRSENLQRGCYSTLRVFRAEDWEWRRSPVSQGWFSPQTNCEKEAHLPHGLMNRKVSAEIRAIINGSRATVM